MEPHKLCFFRNWDFPDTWQNDLSQSGLTEIMSFLKKKKSNHSIYWTALQVCAVKKSIICLLICFCSLLLPPFHHSSLWLFSKSSHSHLPKEKITESHLTRGADEQVRIRRIVAVQTLIQQWLWNITEAHEGGNQVKGSSPVASIMLPFWIYIGIFICGRSSSLASACLPCF